MPNFPSSDPLSSKTVEVVIEVALLRQSVERLTEDLEHYVKANEAQHAIIEQGLDVARQEVLALNMVLNKYRGAAGMLTFVLSSLWAAGIIFWQWFKAKVGIE
jgi:hypothetical protein